MGRDWSSARSYTVSSDDNLSSHSKVNIGFPRAQFKIQTVEGDPLLVVVGSETFLKLRT